MATMSPPSNAMAAAARSQFRQAITPAALRSYLAESISTFFFVFAAVGSSMSARSLTAPAGALSGAASLVATAVAQGCALFVAIYISFDISGGHLNPAVTFAFAVAGRIPIPKALFYWAVQLLSATFACLLLKTACVGQDVPTTGIPPLMTGFSGAIIEGVITFILVFTIFVSVDPRTAKGPPGMAPGLVVAACVMTAGGSTGGSMNPVRSFGPAAITGDFSNQAVYWVGPLIGATVAALMHQNLLFPAHSTPSQAQPPQGLPPAAGAV